MVRTRLVGLLALLFVAVPVVSGAQDAVAPAAVASGDEATHQALRGIKQDMEDALNKQDLDRLLSHLHPDVVFSTMNNDVRVGKDAIRAYYAEMLGGPNSVVKKVTAKFDVDALTRLYGNSGVAYGSSLDHYILNDGTDLVVNGRWTCTLVKEGDQWLIAAFHYSTNVFDNPLLTKVKNAAMGFGALVAVAALGAGFFIGRRGRRTARA
ncbi:MULTISPECIES: SgcJ/EcaC family oxidoreductase [Corallococcus]|uniref:SgcJ/EcaC family oxidoreductase n=1 Tax=Corallococcus TaxID=83461 RepID=UPI000EC6CC93|nr:MULTISPECIES: SgcJ/EcaC family oxidoreductase [Corallococcus]NPC74839.1 SgcJ/EcaC family oxidoreductase [Corallococcus exiguus]NPD28789.1 SgcJ/EcaC family oxidoreductase [Corallococcus exiguus]NRD46767.1 SgcJ/EcaC family oxidoreductase [Corallococcus exiguus]RKH97140.1 SgcJ/EcaC family oxidoreductase [Corallococcus sp. AB038B]